MEIAIQVLFIVYIIPAMLLFLIGLFGYREDPKNCSRLIFLGPIWPLCVIFYILLWIIKIFIYIGKAFKEAEWKTLVKDWWSF